MPLGDVFVHDTYLTVTPAGYAAVVVGFLFVLLVGLMVVRPRLAGTTLTGPWWWTVACLAAIGGCEALLALQGVDTVTADAWRFAVGVGVFCPLMSLLGAKRPQDRAWHFIVLSLWGMLALPALEGMVLRPGQPLAIIDARAWFLLALSGLQVLVMLPTRHWLAALLVGAAQTWLLWSYLPWVDGETSVAHVAGASLLALLAFMITMRHRPRASNAPFDIVWLDFRDAFGALWGARVLERVNAAAVMYAWPIRLGWNGFHAADNPSLPAEISPALAADLKQNLVNLLRRFVSQEWIEQRLQA